MSDYSEHGAEPVEDAAVEDPPTESEVKEAQERHHPRQAATAQRGDAAQNVDALRRDDDADDGSGDS